MANVEDVSDVVELALLVDCECASEPVLDVPSDDGADRDTLLSGEVAVEICGVMLSIELGGVVLWGELLSGTKDELLSVAEDTGVEVVDVRGDTCAGKTPELIEVTTAILGTTMTVSVPEKTVDTVSVVVIALVLSSADVPPIIVVSTFPEPSAVVVMVASTTK